MLAKEKLENWGYADVVVFDNPGYDDALIGVSHDNRAIYDMEKMIDWLVEKDGMTEEEALEFIDYNTIRACDYIADSPIVMYKVE